MKIRQTASNHTPVEVRRNRYGTRTFREYWLSTHAGTWRVTWIGGAKRTAYGIEVLTSDPYDLRHFPTYAPVGCFGHRSLREIVDWVGQQSAV